LPAPPAAASPVRRSPDRRIAGSPDRGADLLVNGIGQPRSVSLLHFPAARLTDKYRRNEGATTRHEAVSAGGDRRRLLAWTSTGAPELHTPHWRHQRCASASCSFGTVHGADVIHRHSFDTGTVSLTPSRSPIPTLPGVADGRRERHRRLRLLFVAVQRAAGVKLCFAAVLELVAAFDWSAITHPCPGGFARPQAGRRRRPVEQSWLVVQAAGHAQGIDLASAATWFMARRRCWGQLRQGELDAVLTYWNFAAELEAAASGSCLGRPMRRRAGYFRAQQSGGVRVP